MTPHLQLTALRMFLVNLKCLLFCVVCTFYPIKHGVNVWNRIHVAFLQVVLIALIIEFCILRNYYIYILVFSVRSHCVVIMVATQPDYTLQQKLLILHIQASVVCLICIPDSQGSLCYFVLLCHVTLYWVLYNKEAQVPCPNDNTCCRPYRHNNITCSLPYSLAKCRCSSCAFQHLFFYDKIIIE